MPHSYYLTTCSWGVSTATSTSYFYVKGLQLEDIPVLSLLLFLFLQDTCIFCCAVVTSGMEERPEVSGTTCDWGPSLFKSGMKGKDALCFLACFPNHYTFYFFFLPYCNGQGLYYNIEYSGGSAQKSTVIRLMFTSV